MRSKTVTLGFQRYDAHRVFRPIKNVVSDKTVTLEIFRIKEIIILYLEMSQRYDFEGYPSFNGTGATLWIVTLKCQRYGFGARPTNNGTWGTFEIVTLKNLRVYGPYGKRTFKGLGGPMASPFRAGSSDA